MKQINPWPWSASLGFSQGILAESPSRILLCDGQVSLDENGAVRHPGDIRAQLGQSLDNLETVLRQAGMSLANIARLVIYTTDVDALIPHLELLGARLGAAGTQPAETLLGVSRLAFPDLLVELEATAIA
jgi:enamine deaminase RidA (YjgF/YER057c/UK114 family)